MDTLGVVGLGRMGLPIAARLCDAGYDVSVFDLRPAAIDRAREAGARPAPSATALAARVDTLITVLPGGGELADAMLGSDGMLSAMRRGSCWLDLTSADPRIVGDIAALADAAGVASVGAPMGGGPESAASGALRFFVGGGPEGVERVRPILESLGGPDSLTVMGPDIREGYTTKLLANTLWFTQAVAVTEALLLGQAAGLDVRSLRDALAASAGGSAFLTDHSEALLAGDYLTTFGIDRVVEELDAVTALAATLGTPGDLTAHVASLHRDALERFGLVDGELLVAKLLEERAHRTLRVDTGR
jgi:3-hydroxyisobutyrate dehydrogenase-like beta-hydroxyacid dehydrogenase